MCLSAPYGYVAEEASITLNQRQASVVWDIFSLFIHGDTPEEIAQKLNKFHIGTQRRHSHWQAESICQILKNSAYATGKLDRDACEFTLPSIIDRQMFDEAQSRLHELGLHRCCKPN